MSSRGDFPKIDRKLFMKAVQEKFKALNMSLDDMTTPSRTKSSRGQTYVVKGKEDSDSEGDSFINRRGSA